MSKYTNGKSVYVGFLHTECAAVCQHFRLIFHNIGWGGKYSERPHRFWSCWNRSGSQSRELCFQLRVPRSNMSSLQDKTNRPVVSAEVLYHWTAAEVCMKRWKRQLPGSHLLGFFWLTHSETKVIGLTLVGDDTTFTLCTERGAIPISNSHLPAVSHWCLYNPTLGM